MRNFFVLLLTATFGVGLLTPLGAAQPTDPPKKEGPEKILADLLKAVKDKGNIDARIQAISALAEFGPKAAPALADLLDALQDKNEDLRLNAALTLAKIGKPAVKPVAKLLKSDDKDTKFYAIWTIGWIGPDAQETVPTMIKLMSDKNEAVRRKAAFALGRLAGDPDKTISVLVEAFKDENDEVRQAAGDALSKFGKSAVAPLIDLLKSDNPKARMQASTSLGDIGSEAKDAVPLLKDLYLAKDSGANVYHYAQMLAKIGKTSLPALEAGFKDARAEVRQAASQAMTTLGGEAVGILVDGLSDKNVEVRRLAAQTLWPMRIGDKSVVIALAFALADSDEQVRQNSMNALATLGAQAKLAGLKLKDVLVDMNPNIRQQAYFLLQQIGDDPRPTLTKALQSKDSKVRINTASLMVSVNFDRDAALPVLVEALKNDDLGLKTQAAFTLAQHRLQNDKVMPIFLESLKHKTPSVRAQGLQGMSMFGNLAVASAPAIAEMLRDTDANVRQHAVYALQNVGGSKPEIVVPILTKIYNDGTVETRRMILQVSYIYGGKAKDLVSAGLKDKDPGVRQQAINALQNLRGDLTEAIPTILSLLKDKDAGINRTQLVWLLSRTGEGAAPHLNDLLKDSDRNVRVTAIQALRNLGPKVFAKSMPAIREIVKDSDSVVRSTAMQLIAQAGGDGPEFLAKMYPNEKDANVRANLIQALVQANQKKYVLPLLQTAMKDESALVRQTTVNSLGNFGQDSKEGFEAFTSALKDSDAQVRTTAGYLGSFYRDKCWQPLEEELKSTKDSNFRLAILQSLQNSAYRSKSGVAPLIDCLKDSNGTVRHIACNLLTNMGADAAAALPALRLLAADTNPSNLAVQQAARNAVQRIGAKDK